MPHASLKLKPGIDQNETPALNEAGISTSNLIRFIYDRNGLGLIQKLGGWTKFYGGQMVSIVRALWAWEDTNSFAHLAYGTQNIAGSYTARLGCITNGVDKNITPTSLTANIPPAASTIFGSPYVVITDDIVSGITKYDVICNDNVRTSYLESQNTTLCLSRHISVWAVSFYLDNMIVTLMISWL